MLGSPLGSAEFEAKHIRLKVDKIKDTTALLPLLEDPHMVGEEEERERARLLSLTLNHAGDWLNTPPQSRR